jgi:hypothetical protein
MVTWIVSERASLKDGTSADKGFTDIWMLFELHSQFLEAINLVRKSVRKNCAAGPGCWVEEMNVYLQNLVWFLIVI